MIKSIISLRTKFKNSIKSLLLCKIIIGTMFCEIKISVNTGHECQRNDSQHHFVCQVVQLLRAIADNL